MCAAVSESRSAAMRAGRRSAIGGDRKTFHETAQRQLVSVSAESADHCPRDIGQCRSPALRLARVDVGEMNFHKRDFYSRQRIANGEAGVAVRSGVDERTVSASTQRLHRVDDFPFSIVLREGELDTELFRDGQETLLDVGECLRSIQSRFARAEQIEIGAIDDCDFHSPVSPSSHARNFATSSSDSCACGSRGFTRGVGIGGVGGVLAVPPGAPLKAPASRDAARLSDGFTVAPANTTSSEAPGAPVATGGGAGSFCIVLVERAPPPPEAPAVRGGRRLPNVAKNSLIEG